MDQLRPAAACRPPWWRRIGGSTGWKLGPAARALVCEAKRRGQWVRMGRVNSLKRIAYAAEIGCDSIDGTGWMRWRNIRLPEGLQAVSAPPQRALPDSIETPPTRWTGAPPDVGSRRR